jgi:ABC-type methionine transport system permease subunit
MIEASSGIAETEAEVAVAALVAAFLGLALAVVIYICSVCQARSFNACVDAVVSFWTTGC